MSVQQGQSSVGFNVAQIERSRNFSLADMLWCSLLAILLTAGTIILLLVGGGVPFSILFVVVVTVVQTVLLNFLYYKIDKIFIFFLVPLAEAVVTIMIWGRAAANGWLQFYNGWSAAFGRRRGNIVDHFALLGDGSDSAGLPFFFILILLLSFLFTWQVISNRSFVAGVIALSAISLTFYVRQTSLWGMALLFIGFCATFLRSRAGDVSETKVVNLRFRLWPTLLAIVIILPMLLTSAGAQQLTSVQNLKERLDQSINNLRYGETSVLPEGDFTRIKNFEPKDKTDLEVVMSVPDSYYLRGFVGGVYTGLGWESIAPEDRYDDADLFYWLHEAGFFGQTQLAALSQELDADMTEGTMSVRNVGTSSRYIYAPYELSQAESDLLPPTGIGDERAAATGPFGEKYYAYTVVPNQVKQYTHLGLALHNQEREDAGLVADYLRAEQHYNNYVYENYLEIPESSQRVLVQELGFYDGHGYHAPYGEAKQNILYTLASSYTYSEEAEPPIYDFTAEFLQVSRSGYSVHFATAAALMFRHYGIPARYVEGYLITPEDVDDLLANSSLEVKDTHAHAWVEFYQDGVGWVPFETTPPYLHVMEKADDFGGSSSTQAQPPFEQGDTQFDDDSKDLSDQPEVEGTRLLRQQRQRKILQTILWILLILLLLALLIFLIIVLWRRHKLRSYFAEIKDMQRRRAAIYIFAYIVKLLYKVEIFNETNAPYEAAPLLIAVYGKPYSELYEASFSVYQKARFSQNQIADEDMVYLQNLLKETLSQVKNQRSGWERFADRFVRVWYL